MHLFKRIKELYLSRAFRMTDKTLRHVEAHRAETSRDTHFLRHIEAHRAETSRNGAESGRSMVEMLGVLMIIGLLSSLGVWGFTTARDWYFANRLRDAVLQEGAALISDRKMRRVATGPISSVTDMDAVLPAGLDNSDYTIIKESDPFGYKFTITVKTLSPNVCKRATDVKAPHLKTNSDRCDDGIGVFVFLQTGNIAQNPAPNPNPNPGGGCPSGETELSNGSCCPDAQVCNDTCCDETTEYCSENTMCCEPGTEYSAADNDCCYMVENKCCPINSMGTLYWNPERTAKDCCPVGSSILTYDDKNICCLAGTPAYGGEAKECCVTGQIEANGRCCQDVKPNAAACEKLDAGTATTCPKVVSMCGTGQTCQNGTCECPSGQEWNATAEMCCPTVDTASTCQTIDVAASAGSCPTYKSTCGTGQTCQSGTCQCPSGQGWNATAEMCCPTVDTTSTCQEVDAPASAGSCPTYKSACTGGQTCQNGVCDCPSDQEWNTTAGMCCDNVDTAATCQEVDTSASAGSCPTYKTTCGSGQTCQSGVCECINAGEEWSDTAEACVIPCTSADSTSCSVGYCESGNDICVAGGTSCQCCSVSDVSVCETGGGTMGSDCTCQCPKDTPIWDDTLNPPACRTDVPATQSCTTNADCTNDAAPVCNTSLGICEACSPDSPRWNGWSCTECLTNADCNGGSETGNYYCGLRSLLNNATDYNETDYKYWKLQGICQEVGDILSIPVEGFKTIYTRDTGVWYNDYGDWFGARNWCAAQGMRLIPDYRSYFNCYLIDYNNGGGWCFKDKASADANNRNDNGLSPSVLKLRDAIKNASTSFGTSTSFWTSTMYTDSKSAVFYSHMDTYTISTCVDEEQTPSIFPCIHTPRGGVDLRQYGALTRAGMPLSNTFRPLCE